MRDEIVNRMKADRSAPPVEEGSCSFSRTVDMVKERWTFLVLRESLIAGATRFEDFLQIPGLSTRALAERLDMLVAAGVMNERHATLGGTDHFSYHLSEQGMQLVIILRALGDWADRFAQ
ncbi:winged helix-turn-helix transcriptional regulator [Promicromonospora sp. NPDC019610]|uniref:winged helix-turn-helix transcriptional regulator n=1 Tax=Promicromonospora sp. NPDC019610 TaxID=3364405 RepID=UPI003793309A